MRAGGTSMRCCCATRLFRPPRGRRARKRVQRQPGRSLPDRRVHRQDAEAALHAQVGSADGARRSVCIAGWAATPSPASATARCGASATATTARSMAISSATAAATVMSSSIASAGSGNPCCENIEPNHCSLPANSDALQHLGEMLCRRSSGDRDRFSARFDRSQFCVAHPRWARPVLSRNI